MNNGYSLIEMVIAISIATLLITSIVGGVFILHRGFIRTEENAVVIEKMAKFFELLSGNVLNPDIHPHHPIDQYILQNQF